jgi:hypothetical protein
MAKGEHVSLCAACVWWVHAARASSSRLHTITQSNAGTPLHRPTCDRLQHRSLENMSSAVGHEPHAMRAPLHHHRRVVPHRKEFHELRGEVKSFMHE